MKKYITVFFLQLYTLTAFGQMHDNTWVIGYQGTTSIKLGFSVLTFSNGTMKIDTANIPNVDSNDNNSSFSSSSGDLIAFFYGFDIRDRSYGIMKNGGGLNVDIEKFVYSLSDDDLPQGSIFLPYPGHLDSCILFYMSQQFLNKPNGQVDIVSSDLSFAVIDTKSNNGLGQVVSNQASLIHDTIQYGRLNAVKHANGRDWWMLVQETTSNQFYTLLIDSKGVHIQGQQTIALPITDGVGNTVFSPDGKKCAIYNTVSQSEGIYLDVFDFDRCTGRLDNQKQLRANNGFGFVSFSPSGRFLYQAHTDEVYQYDLNADDIWASKTVVGVYDGFMDPFPNTFYQMQLAPDGRIYGTATNSMKSLHVIKDPDEKGLGCHFLNHGVRLPKVNSFSVPNHPNYRLGPLDGSPCDTLGLNNWPRAWYRYEPDTLDPLRVDFHDLSYYEPATWLWDFGDGKKSTERHPDHFYAAKGVYEVCITVSNVHGSNTHCKTLYLGVSAQDNPVLQSQVLVSPNPFVERLQVALSANLRSPLFHLYDAMGRLVREERLAFGITEIEASGLVSGLYFWEVTAGGERVKAGKAVKQE